MKPPLQCQSCQRRIGARASHILIGEPPTLLCVSCLSDRRSHGRYFPDCPHHWHDMYDHRPLRFATKAAAHRVLGEPNEKEDTTT